MPRIARIVVPNCPHHVTNRGNRRQAVFFSDEDKGFYLHLLSRYGDLHGLKYWAYCLMFNHIHLIAVPEKSESLNLTLREAHKKYSTHVNLRMDWRGSLWQGRYYSFPLDEIHLYRALRYTENNPVRAGIVKYAEEYPWSSARAHIHGKKDPLLAPINPLKLQGKQWAAFLREREEEEEIEDIRHHIQTGRPLGEDEFIDDLEKSFNRSLRPQKRGPRKRRIIGDASLNP